EDWFAEVRATVIALGTRAAVIHGEGGSRLGGENARKRPATESLTCQSVLSLTVGNVPNAGKSEPLADIVGGIRTIRRGTKRTSESKPEIDFKGRVAKERALVIDRMSPGVGAEEQEPGLADFLRLEVQGQSVVSRETFVSPAIHARKPCPIDPV